MKKVAVFLADGFETIEALTVVDVMRRAKVQCDTVSLQTKEVRSTHNIYVNADILIKGFDCNEYDMIVLPGGLPGATNLRDNIEVINIVKEFNENNKFIAAICAAPIVLKKADIIKDKNITSYPSFKAELEGSCNYKEETTIIDGNIITSRGPSTALEFSYKLLETLGYGNESEVLKKSMLYI